jgi:hypothetical protein
MLVSIYAAGVASAVAGCTRGPNDEGQNQDKGDHCQNRDASDPSPG